MGKIYITINIVKEKKERHFRFFFLEKRKRKDPTQGNDVLPPRVSVAQLFTIIFIEFITIKGENFSENLTCT